MADGSHILKISSAAAQMLQAQRIYQSLFEYSPLPLLVLTPDMHIVNANGAYLEATMQNRDAIVGLEMFKAFPDNPHDPHATGTRNLRASLLRVLETGRHDVMGLQRYDVKPENLPWTVRYWNPKNWPILDDAGSIIGLVHHVSQASSGLLDSSRRQQFDTLALIARADEVVRVARMNVEDAQADLRVIRSQMAALRLRK